MVKKVILETIAKCLDYLDKHGCYYKLALACYGNVSSWGNYRLEQNIFEFFNMPKIFLAKNELIPFYEKWLNCKDEWYKKLASNYPESWIPISNSNYMNGDTEVFIDSSDRKLPIIFAKYLPEGIDEESYVSIKKYIYRDNFIVRRAYRSLLQFINKDGKKKDDLYDCDCRDKNCEVEHTGDLFYEQNQKYDKLIISKAFADAYKRNDVSIVEPYIANPINYSSGVNRWNDNQNMDKESFLKILSFKINELHSCGKVSASIIPISIKGKFWNSDVLVKHKFCIGQTKQLTIEIETFLNSVSAFKCYEF